MPLQDVATLTGFVLDSIGFLTLGLTLGRWRAGRNRRKLEVAEAITLATGALSGVRLTGCRVEPLSLRRGQSVSITYEVTSDCPTPVTVWLGADCWPYYDVTQDKEVTIESGPHRYSRSLTIGEIWPTGRHDLGVGVWIGVKSLPEQSLRLQAKVPAATIEVF
jgi:hypothetical protein